MEGSSRIQDLLRDVSARRLRIHKQAKLELLSLADELENVPEIVHHGSLAAAVLFMAQSKDYYRYIGVEILIRLCNSGLYWDQIAPQKDFFFHTITDLVDSYTEETAGASSDMQTHIASRLQVMRATAERLNKLKRESFSLAMLNAVNAANNAPSTAARKPKRSRKTSTAPPATTTTTTTTTTATTTATAATATATTTTTTAAGNASRAAFAARVADLDELPSTASAAPVDAESFVQRVVSASALAASPTRYLVATTAPISPRAAVGATVAARVLSKDFEPGELELVDRLPPPPLPDDGATTNAATTTSTVTPPPLPPDDAADSGARRQRASSPPPPPPPPPPLTSSSSSSSSDDATTTSAISGSGSRRKKSARNNSLTKSGSSLAVATTTSDANKTNDSGSKTMRAARPSHAAPLPPSSHSSVGTPTTTTIATTTAAAATAANENELKRLRVALMVASGALGNAKRTASTTPTPTNLAVLETARLDVRRLETQIAELQQRTSQTTTATPIATTARRTAGVTLTSSSRPSYVRLDRSMSIDTSGFVDDVKSADERGREACLLAMLGDMSEAADSVSDDSDDRRPTGSRDESDDASSRASDVVLVTLPPLTKSANASTSTATTTTTATTAMTTTTAASAQSSGKESMSSKSSATSSEGSGTDSKRSSAEISVDAREVKRMHAAQEILDTEQRYVACMSSIVDNYKAALEESLSAHLSQRRPASHKGDELPRGPHAIASAAQIKTMFSNAQAILNTNRVLLKDVRARVGEWNAKSRLGDVFLRLSDFFKIYIEYANNYDAAHDELDKLLTESEAFLRFCEAMELRDGLQLGLEDLLIMPVQRLPRYVMLLESLYKYTPEDHIDRAPLQQAIAKFADVSQQINDTNREVEQRRKVFDVQQQLILPPGFPPLVAPHRLLLREEACTIVAHAPVIRRRAAQLFLFNDLIALAIDDKTGRGGRRTLIASVALRTSRVARLADQKGADGGDDITNAMVVIDLSNGSQANGSKQHIFCLATAELRDEMFGEIDDAKASSIHAMISRELED